MITNDTPRGSVLSLLCAANAEIDRMAGVPRQLLPKIERNTLNHHVVALAGILRRTSADSITAQVGAIIVEVRRTSKCDRPN